VILAAGRGSRLASVTDDPKCLLEVGGATLLERHLAALEARGVDDVVLVVGYRADRLAQALPGRRRVRWIRNDDFERHGNAYSLWLGLQAAQGRDVVVFDADVAYDASVLASFLEGPRDAVLVGEGSLDDEECAKVLVDASGRARRIVDKRRVSADELRRLRFAGEAVGLLRFSREAAGALARACEAFFTDARRLPLNWEHLLNAFLPAHDVETRRVAGGRWIEIDTPEDLARARALFAPGWGAADVDPRAVVRPLPATVREELRAFAADARLASLSDVQALAIEPALVPAAVAEVARLREELDRGLGFAAVALADGDTSDLEVVLGSWLLANLLGRPEVQNERGDRVYAVFDAHAGTMRQGARYSRTRDGGSFHTDNVNLEDPLDYSVLTCLTPAARGGESVLLDGRSVLDALAARAPSALTALTSPRRWEWKGIRSGEFYEAPILTLNGRPTWRYLRDYLVEAFAKRGEARPDDLVRAMDALDEVLQLPALQLELRLDRGHMLLWDDRRLFHGRRPFEDDADAVSLAEVQGPLDGLLRDGGSRRLGRTMIRIYLRAA
jgi:choline kinase/alpha-ketoglutarate-dependent taurine dioxygenase